VDDTGPELAGGHPESGRREAPPAGPRLAASACERCGLAAFALLAVAAGIALRFWNLGGQVLGGDELHAVRAALSQPLPALLTTYQLADSCIPLTALDRLLLDRGVALDEWRLRLPVLASGLAALAVLPALGRRRLEPAARALFCALVALSPLLVLYSRIARSYMPATLLSFAAVMAFDSWWAPGRGSAAGSGAGRAAGVPAAAGGTRAPGANGPLAALRHGVAGPALGPHAAAVAYVVLAALAVWFHLGTAPIVVAPLLYGAGELAFTRGSHTLSSRGGASGREASRVPSGGGGDRGGRGPWLSRRLAALAAAGAGLAVSCALFLVPAYPSLARLVDAKRQALEVPAATWWTVLRLQAGTGQRLPALLFWAAALVGLAALLRRRPRLGGYLAALALAQPLGILALSPLGLARPQVLDRYLLPALPIMLLWVAAGLAHPWWPRQGRLGRAGQMLGAAGLVLVWLAAGPFADPDFRASSFMHHNDMVTFALPRATAPPGGPPVPYRALGGPPGSAVVELPWPPSWDFGRCFYVYQEIHGLRVLVATPAAALPAGRLRLRNRVGADPAALLGSGARYVAVHRHLAVEEERLRLPPGAPPPRRMPAALAAQLATDGERAAERLAAAWGPPAFADADVAVWDLRRRPGARPGGGGEVELPAARTAPPAESN
jgi:hypothetical protein